MMGESECVYVTEELVLEILLRLPVKAVMRFKCVCKSWNSLINSSSFIAAKQLLLRRDYPVFIITITGVCDSRTVRETRILSYDTLVAHGVFDNRKNSSLSLTHPPRPRLLGFDNRWTKICCLSCCDGVLFINYPISKEEDGFPVRCEYALWNPATGDTKVFPVHVDRYDQYLERLERYGCVDNFGCGFDSKNNEYRPLLVRSDWRLYSIEIEIYSFISNKWKLIEFSGVTSHGYNKEVVYANGICHWVGFSSLAEKDAIVSFDMTNEVILTTPFPDDYTYNTDDASCEPCYRPYLLLFNDSLALVKRLNIDTLEVVDLDYDDRFEVAPHIDDIDDADRYEVAGTASFDVWVLGEYGNKDSWTKLFTVGPLPGIEKVVGFWNETKIFVTDGDCQLFLYDTVTPQALKLQMIGPGSNICLGVFTCRQSLYPIVDPLLLKSVPKNTKVKKQERVRVLSLNKKRQLRLGRKRKR